MSVAQGPVRVSGNRYSARMDAPFQLPISHRRRLREIWRSAGWPCQDLIEIDLLAAGLLQRVQDPDGRERLRVSDTGVQVLAHTLQSNRGALTAHETLVARVALEMQRAGRIAWRGLSLRARIEQPGLAETPAVLPLDPEGAAPPAGGPPHRWVMAMPDVYSIRNTTVEDYACPIVHEVKVRRADLQSDLRNAAKRAAYLDLCSECWYVLAEGIAQPDEVPAECGVLVARPAAGGGTVLDVARPAPRRAMRLPFGVWLALAKATPVAPPLDEAQGWLGDPDAL
jgi:hypothetical protein